MNTPRTILLAALVVGAFGCKANPEQAVVGVWSPDPTHTTLPKLGNPVLEKQAEEIFGNTTLKVHSDHTYELLLLKRDVNGKWSLKENTLTLENGKGTSLNLELGSDQKSATFKTASPAGDVIIGLRKTG